MELLCKKHTGCMLWTTKETLGEKEKMHGTNYRVVFDRCWFVHGSFCSINLQGTLNGENQQKASIYHWFVFWRISGADAIDRLVSRNPIPAVYYLDRSLDRIYSACMYRWKDGCGSRS